MKKLETQKFSFAIGKPYALLYKYEQNIIRGGYYFQYGIVSIYFDNQGEKRYYYLSMTVVRDGRVYQKNIFGKNYTSIGIARKAGEFAKEIFPELVRKN